MALCGAVTVTELFVSGDVTFDQIKESRVRQFVVTSDTGCVIFPANITNPDLGAPFAQNWDWNIGNRFPGDKSLTGLPTTSGTLLTVQRVTISQLTPTALKVTCVYGTDPAQWRWKKRTEVVAESQPVLIDLDARDFFNGGCPGNFSVPAAGGAPHALDWCQHVASGNKVLGDEYLLGPTEGVDVSFGKYNLVFSGLLPDTRDAGGIGALGGMVWTQNFDEFFAGSNDQQKWLLKSFNAEEIKWVEPNLDAAIWRAELRFEFDPFWHRRVLPLRKHGGISNKGATTGAPGNERTAWRSARVFELSTWTGLDGLGIPV